MTGFHRDDEVDIQRLEDEWIAHRGAQIGRQLLAENRASAPVDDGGPVYYDEEPDWSVLKFAIIILLGIGGLVLAYLALSVVLMALGVIAFGAAFLFGWRLISPLGAAVFMLPVVGLAGMGSAAVGLFWVKLVLGLAFGVGAFGLVTLPVLGPIMAYQYATDTHHFTSKDHPDWWRYEVKREQGIIRVYVTNLHASRPMHVMSGLNVVCDYHGGPNGIVARINHPDGFVPAGKTYRMHFRDSNFGYPGWEHRINASSCVVR